MSASTQRSLSRSLYRYLVCCLLLYRNVVKVAAEDNSSKSCAVFVKENPNPFWAGFDVAFDGAMASLDFSNSTLNLNDVIIDNGVFVSGAIVDENTVRLVRPEWMSTEQFGYFALRSNTEVDDLLSIVTPSCNVIDSAMRTNNTSLAATEWRDDLRHPDCIALIKPDPNLWWVGFDVGFDTDKAYLDFSNSALDINDIRVDSGVYPLARNLGNQIVGLQKPSWMSRSRYGYFAFRSFDQVEEFLSVAVPTCLSEDPYGTEPINSMSEGSEAVTDNGDCTVILQDAANPHWVGFDIGFDTPTAQLDFSNSGLDLSTVNIHRGVFPKMTVVGQVITLEKADWVSQQRYGYFALLSNFEMGALVTITPPVCTAMNSPMTGTEAAPSEDSSSSRRVWTTISLVPTLVALLLSL